MKTVYEWLHEIGKEELVLLYSGYEHINFSTIRNQKMKLSKVFERYSQRIDAFITDIFSCEPRPNREMVFFAVEYYRDGLMKTEARLVSLKELHDKRVETYGWSLTDREEWLGYHVAETELTLSGIRDMLTYILHEASFYGYTREEFEEGREEFARSIEAAENETCCTEEMLWAEMGLPQRKDNPREDALREELWRAEAALDQYCFDREINELILHYGTEEK